MTAKAKVAIGQAAKTHYIIDTAPFHTVATAPCGAVLISSDPNKVRPGTMLISAVTCADCRTAIRNKAKLESFLKWYAANGLCGDPRVDPKIGDVQDVWLSNLDDGCEVCGAKPWEECAAYEDEHEREFTRCAKYNEGCRVSARLTFAGKTWCDRHAKIAGQ